MNVKKKFVLSIVKTPLDHSSVPVIMATSLSTMLIVNQLVGISFSAFHVSLMSRSKSHESLPTRVCVSVLSILISRVNKSVSKSIQAMGFT